jgi:Ca2+-binding RTX toxin-like protein
MPDIIGTPGTDVLIGTAGDDVIVANGGEDTIDANDGDDVVRLISQLTRFGNINGAMGFDTLQLDRMTNPVFGNGSGGPFAFSLAYLGDSEIASFERLRFNSQVGDVFRASLAFGGNRSSLNQLGSGLAADAELVGGAGQDILTLVFRSEGLAGTVTVPSFSYSNWLTPTRAYGRGDEVAISVSDNGATIINAAPHAGIMRITGNAGNDQINGSDDIELISASTGGADVLNGNGGNDGFTVMSTYLRTNGVAGAENQASSFGATIDGGTGTDFLIFGGNVLNFSSSVRNVEGIYLIPSYSNLNNNGAALSLLSQYRTNVLLSNSVFAQSGANPGYGLPDNLILDGVGSLTIRISAGLAFDARNFVFELGSSVSLEITADAGNHIIWGSSGNDTLSDSGGANFINAGAGNDRIYLGNSNGSDVDGGTGYDELILDNFSLTPGTIFSGLEKITLWRGATLVLTGEQFASGLAANSTVTDAGQIAPGNGQIVVNMNTGVSFVAANFNFSGAVSMVVNGTAGADIIKCGGISHTVNAGDGNDLIRGGTAVDPINGGAGNDKILGFGGADILTGGAGNDQFRYMFATDSGIGALADRISDYTIGGDRLNFSALDTNAGLAGIQGFAFVGSAAFSGGGAAQLRYANSGADLLVQADVDGDGFADMEIILQGLAGGTLTAADFIL